MLLKLGDIASQIPPASRASLFDADRVVELPATDLFAGPVPRLSLARLAELAPDCVLKPAQDTKIKLPASRLALSYKMAETAELIEEALPLFAAAPAEPVFSAEAPAVEEDRFAPESLPFPPAAESMPEPPAAAIPAIPAPAPAIVPPPRSIAHKSMTAKVSDPDRPPAPVRLTPQPAPPPAAPVARAVEPPAPFPAPPVAHEEAPIAPPAPTAPLVPPPAPRVSPLPQERKSRPFFPMFRRKEQPESPATPPPPPAGAAPVPEAPKNTGRIEIPRPKSTFLPRPKPAGLTPIATPAPEAPAPVAVPRHVAVAPPAPPPEPIMPPPPVEPPAAVVEPELIAEPAPAADFLPEPPAPPETEAVYVETEHLPRESDTPPPEIPEQDSLQAVFMTEEFLTVERVVELCGGLPGVTSCVLSRGAGVVASHHVPENFDLVSLSAHALEMLSAMRASAAKMGVGAVPAVTIHSAKGPITFFQQEDLCLLVLHKDRGFIPGVREKLQRVIEELSRANLPLPVGQPRPAIKPF